TVIGRLVCLPICSKHSATSSAHTLTSASISQASSIQNGSSLLNTHPKSQPNRKLRSPITRESSATIPVANCKPEACATLTKIMRLAADELLVRKRSDFASFDQNDVVGILHLTFN